MPVTDVTTDTDTRTIVITAEFAAPLSRVWALYGDPRQLEQVWGPPEYPATFVDHELAAGSRTTYYMTSPEGEKYAGYWEIDAVEPQTSFAFRDGFALDAETFAANTGMPECVCTYEFREEAGTTTATYTSVYATAEGLQQVLDMGVLEGASSAINQIDALLAA